MDRAEDFRNTLVTEKQQADRLTALYEQLPKKLEAVKDENSKFKVENTNLQNRKENSNTELTTSNSTVDEHQGKIQDLDLTSNQVVSNADSLL